MGLSFLKAGILRVLVSVGAMGASEAMVFESVGASTTVFDKFLTFASIFIEIMRKILYTKILIS